MNKKLFQSGKSLLSKLCLTSLLLIGMGNTAWADELTVAGTTQPTYSIKNQPIAGNILASTLTKSEFQIPKAKLADLADKRISNLSFPLKAATTTWGEAEFQVFLKEVDISAYNNSNITLKGSEGAIIVYEGALDPTSSTINIPFTTTFDYSGEKDLLIGIYCTKTGTNADIEFNLCRDSYVYYTAYTSSSSGSLSTSMWYPVTTFTYTNIPISTPRLSVKPTTADFGSLRASETKTFTVSNTGIGEMAVNITSDNTTDFTVFPTSLTAIGAGESKTFDVTFNYSSDRLGAKIANITVTPDYDAEAAINIEATATAANPNVWEDFSDGIPSTWYNQNGTWLTNVSGLAGQASPGWMSSTDILRTPHMYAEAGEEIGYDVTIGGTSSSYKLKAQYTTDGLTWTDIATYTTTNTYTFAAPETGYYWLRFTGYQSGIDNFTGWSIADPTHYTKLGTATIPTTGTVHGTYTAKVNVMELGGSEENITAELYFGETKVTEETMTISGNRDETITLTYDLTEAFSGEVSIKVLGDNIETMETDKVNVTIGETTYVLDENTTERPSLICTDAVVRVNYNAKKGWNTIVMPFSLTGKPAYMNNIFGEGWKAYKISGYNDGELSFSKTTYMGVSIPYLVYAPNAESHTDGVYLTNLTIQNYAWTSSNLSQKQNDATFQGTYVPKAYADGEDPWYGLTPDGKIRKAGSGASVKAFHAYFTGISAPASGARLIVIEDDGEATNLGFVQMVEPEAKGVYTLSGQKVESAGKGIYIVNGKKVVIK